MVLFHWVESTLLVIVNIVVRVHVRRKEVRMKGRGKRQPYPRTTEGDGPWGDTLMFNGHKKGRIKVD